MPSQSDGKPAPQAAHKPPLAPGLVPGKSPLSPGVPTGYDAPASLLLLRTISELLHRVQKIVPEVYQVPLAFLCFQESHCLSARQFLKASEVRKRDTSGYLLHIPSVAHLWYGRSRPFWDSFPGVSVPPPRALPAVLPSVFVPATAQLPYQSF